jgi:hypothetical protein
MKNRQVVGVAKAVIEGLLAPGDTREFAVATKDLVAKPKTSLTKVFGYRTKP